MVPVTIYDTRVSRLIHGGYDPAVATAESVYDLEDPKQRFARVIRAARERRGWNQDELSDASQVSRPTIQRWESAKTATPDPENARRVFLALELDPRIIPVLLGYVTPEEMGLAPQVLDPTLEEVIAILDDPRVPAAAKAEWVEFLRFRARAAGADDHRSPRQAS
jgi:transcriptional regulator with XRE-family HTH domain